MACIAVDLDGTLAHFDEWRGLEHIGEPIEPMRELVMQWAQAGHEVWIYSARLSNEHNDRDEAHMHIFMWCAEHLGFVPPTTGTKLGRFDYFFDDRAYHVPKNTGVPTDLPEELR